MFVIAFDLGTTTIAGSLLNLPSGERLACSGAMNPQRTYGADVVSRLQQAVESDKQLEILAHTVQDELWKLTNELCRQAGILTSAIEQFAIAGNPAMQHIFLQLPVKSLAFPPYRPLYTTGTTLPADALGWDSTASVYLFPMPGGFVGGDTVAFLYGEIHKSGSNALRPIAACPHPTLYLDMGTNGEIALIKDTTIWATAAAAGPAFEGGNLSCGMVALPGAISSVQIKEDKLLTTTIGNRPAIGICGSAALQATEQLLSHAILEPGGRLRDSDEIDSPLASRIVQHDAQNAFVLQRNARVELLLTQQDIRQIQLAKSALRAGIEVLVNRAGAELATLSETVLTGSFGAFLQPEWLKSVGIFDQGMVQTCRFVPEGALHGVEQALLADDRFASVEQLGKAFRVVPLSGTPMFEKLFIDNINFPYHT